MVWRSHCGVGVRNDEAKEAACLHQNASPCRGLTITQCQDSEHLTRVRALRAKTDIFYIFSAFLGPGTMSKAFSRPWGSISRQKYKIWMRICRVTAVFIVFGEFGFLLLVLKLNFQAVIKSAASAASLKTKTQESRGASGRRLGWRATEMAGLPWIPGFWSSGRLR